MEHAHYEIFSLKLKGMLLQLSGGAWPAGGVFVAVCWSGPAHMRAPRTRVGRPQALCRACSCLLPPLLAHAISLWPSQPPPTLTLDPDPDPPPSRSNSPPTALQMQYPPLTPPTPPTPPSPSPNPRHLPATYSPMSHHRQLAQGRALANGMGAAQVGGQVGVLGCVCVLL